MGAEGYVGLSRVREGEFLIADDDYVPQIVMRDPFIAITVPLVPLARGVARVCWYDHNGPGTLMNNALDRGVFLPTQTSHGLLFLPRPVVHALFGGVIEAVEAYESNGTRPAGGYWTPTDEANRAAHEQTIGALTKDKRELLNYLGDMPLSWHMKVWTPGRWVLTTSYVCGVGDEENCVAASRHVLESKGVTFDKEISWEFWT